MKTITFKLTEHQIREFKKFMHAKYLCGDLHPKTNPLDGIGVIVIREIAKQEIETESRERMVSGELAKTRPA